jgi:hypothetical protein
MIQELLAYIIVAIAIGLALWKTYKKLAGKKRRRKPDFKKQTFSMEHNCQECIAECILRDSPAMKKKNAELCDTTVAKKAKDS